MKQVDTTQKAREKLFVQAKMQGKTNTEAAMIATGAKDKNVSGVQANRLLRSVNVQQAIAKELKKLKITPAKILKVFAEAMEAQKTIVHGKDPDDSFVEVVPDHNVRMKAAEKFADIMGIKYYPPDTTSGWSQVRPGMPSLQDNPEVQKALEQGNEVEMQRVIFKKEVS